MAFGWLKRYMPRGLYGRAALILILPAVVLQLVVSVSFIQRHFEGVTRQMTRSISLDLAYLVRTVDGAAALAAAVAAAAEVAGPLQLDVALPAAAMPAADERAWIDLSGRVVIETLRTRMPEMGPVDLSDPRRVRLWHQTVHGPMEVSFGRQRVSASNPHQLIVLMVVLGVLMTLIAFIYLRNQLRPIARLARAADAFGKGQVVAYSPSGATEVRSAGRAFLDMRNRIERQAAARQLMLSGISHDLRTPLTRLRLGLGLMDDAEAAPLIRDVDDMTSLLDAFLDYARGDALDEVEPTDVGALLARVVEDAARAGQEVRLLPVPPLAPIPLRPMAIRRAVENLIGNALRYGRRAQVSLAAGERSLRFVVEDDGPGIPADRRDDAMRPFTRLDPARNQDRGSGVGLGLAIVSDIARAHGGQLKLGVSATLGGLQAEIVLPL